MPVATKLPAQKTLNGISNGRALPEGTHDMDIDKVLDILMRLREEGAARDVKLDVVVAGLKEINAFKAARVTLIDATLEEFRRRDSDFGRRLDALEKANLAAMADRLEALEKSGLRGWLEGGTAKRMGTLAALVVGVAAALAVILQLLSWLKAHLHF
jgi:hypothetical protein